MVLLAAVVMPHGTMPFDGDDQSPSPAVRDRSSRVDPAFRDILSQVSSYDGFPVIIIIIIYTYNLTAVSYTHLTLPTKRIV